MSDTQQLTPGTHIGKYELQKIIVSGLVGAVWKARHTVLDSNVAIKVVKKSLINNPLRKERLDREIFLFQKFRHPFIAESYEVIEDENYYYLVMEFIENGMLYNVIYSQKTLSEFVARHYFEELIIVLEYLHNEEKVAHRDLKCENILIDENFDIRVIDFGLSNIFSETNPRFSDACGTLHYVAPEILRGESYNESCDIWSLGVILYAMTVGYLPFDGDSKQEVSQEILYLEPEYPISLTSCLADLLSQLLCKNPIYRITLEKIKDHPWFSMSEYRNLKQKSINFLNSQIIPGNDFIIDNEILQKINSFNPNINADSLYNSLFSGKSDENTIIYRILAHEKLAQSMKIPNEPIPNNQFQITNFFKIFSK